MHRRHPVPRRRNRQEDRQVTRPVVMMTEGFLKEVVGGDENILAMVMGHELAHLTKEHVVGMRKGDTALLLLTFGRDQEIEADINGMRYAVSSGFSFKNGVGKAFAAMRKTPNIRRSRGSTHRIRPGKSGSCSSTATSPSSGRR